MDGTLMIIGIDGTARKEGGAGSKQYRGRVVPQWMNRATIQFSSMVQGRDFVLDADVLQLSCGMRAGP